MAVSVENLAFTSRPERALPRRAGLCTPRGSRPAYTAIDAQPPDARDSEGSVTDHGPPRTARTGNVLLPLPLPSTLPKPK